jgi:hypothetical protein
VTVRDAVVGAVAPVIAAAEQEQNTAQQHLNADKSTEQSTQSQLNALYANIDSRGPHGSMLAYAQTLQHEITQQQQQISADHHAVLAAKAKVAAGNVVAYGQQAQSDQRTAKASAQNAATSYSHLTKILPKGISFKPGGQPLTQAQIDSLNSKQRSAYFDYLNASARATSDQAKVYADNADINKNYAQLQLYASAPKNYGTIAQNAVDAVNKALAPVHLQIAMPSPINVGKAKANLAAADQAKTSVDAYWNFTKAAIPAQAASDNVAAAQAKVDGLNKEINAFQQKASVCLAPNSPLMTQLSAANKALAQAKAAAVQPEAAVGVAYSYLGKVRANGAVMQADTGEQDALSSLGAAQAAYAKWRAAHPGLDAPGNKYELAVNQAERQVALAKQQVAQAHQQASLATAQFNAAYAQLYATQQQAKVAADWQKVASATSCTANPADSPYAIWKADKEAAQAATEVAQEMGDTAKKQGLDYQVAADKNAVKTDQQTVTALTTAYDQWNQEHPGIAQLSHLGISVNDVNPYAKGLAHAQAALSTDQQTLFNDQQLGGAALSQLNYDKFILSLPENLQDPQTTADKQKLAQEVNQYTTTHQFQSGPIDGQQAISQVKQDLGTEKQYLASRGLLESGWDWLTGGNHSGVETYLDSELAKLQTVQGEEKSGQLTDIQYQTDLHNIMHNYGQTYLNLTGAEQAGDAHWRVADDVFRGLASTVVGIVATAASGGDVAVGFMAGFATYQAIDGAENIKTVAEGGNIMDDAHISLGGLLGETIAGHGSMAMLERAGVDTATDAVSSLSAAGGSAIAGKVTNLVVSKAMASLADTAGSEAVGSATAQATRVGLGVTLKASALGNLANQGIMSTGQLVNTAIDVQAHGGLFNAKGGEAMLSAAKDQAFYVATAPMVGALGGITKGFTESGDAVDQSGDPAAPAADAPAAGNAVRRMLFQGGIDLATNVATNVGLTAGDARFNGRNMTTDDWISTLINSAPVPTGHGEADPLGQRESSPSNGVGSHPSEESVVATLPDHLNQPNGSSVGLAADPSSTPILAQADATAVASTTVAAIPDTVTASGDGSTPPQGGPASHQPQQSQQQAPASPPTAPDSAGGQPPQPPPPTGPGGTLDPQNPDGWANQPVYFVHFGADNTRSVSFSGADGTEETVNQNAPWAWEPSGGAPPSEVRIFETSGPHDNPTIDATHLLTHPEGTPEGTYEGIRRDSVDQSEIHYVIGSDNPLFRLPAASDLASLDVSSPDWSGSIHVAKLATDGTKSLWLRSEDGTEAPVDRNAPWTGAPPSEVRIIEESTGRIIGPDGKTRDVTAATAAHYLARNRDGTYSGRSVLFADGSYAETPAGPDPFGGVVARREAPPPRPVASGLKKVGQAFDRGLVAPTVRSFPAPRGIPKAIGHTFAEAGLRMYGSVRPGHALALGHSYPSTEAREVKGDGRGVPTDTNPATGERIPAYTDPATGERIPVSIGPIPGSTGVTGDRIALPDPATGERILAYKDPATGKWHISANTDTRTGEQRTKPPEPHGDGTMGIAHIRDAAVEPGDLPPLTKWAFGRRFLKPRDAETIEQTGRAIVEGPLGLGRTTFLNRKFKAPGGAVEGGVRTELGEHLAGQLLDSPDVNKTTLGNYVAASMRSDVLGIRAATRDAFWKKASAGDITALRNAIRGAPPSPADTFRSELIKLSKKLSKLNFGSRNTWSKKDVNRLFSLIDKSLESGNPAIKQAAEKIVQSVTPDDLNKILTADLNSKFTGSKTTKAVEGATKPGQLSENTVATLERIFDTAAKRKSNDADPLMMNLLENHPELAPQAEKIYADLQRNGLKAEHATGIVTKAAKDAIDASLRYGARSTDKTFREAAKKAQKTLSGLNPGEKYTQAQLEAFIEFMKADQKTNWIGGSKISGSLRGTLSPLGKTIEASLGKPIAAVALERIFETAGPGMMDRLRANAPGLATKAGEIYSLALQAGKAGDTNIATEKAIEAANAMLQDGAMSKGKQVRKAAVDARKALSGLKPGGNYTPEQLDAIIEFMKADQKRNSPRAENYFEPRWTKASVRFWNAYLGALRDAPDEQMRIAWAEAGSRLLGTAGTPVADLPSPKAGEPISATERAAWDVLSKADKASWWKPNMASVDYPSLSRAANAVPLKDFGIHGQNPVNAAGDPALGVLENDSGIALDRYLRSHRLTPFGSALARVAGIFAVPLLNNYYEVDPRLNPEFLLPKDPNDPSKGSIPNITENPTNKKKPWKLNADLTVYVQPHRESRPGITLPFHFHGAPISLSLKLPVNRIPYPGVDPLGRPGHMTIARGEELTNRQAWLLHQLVRLGETSIEEAGTNEVRPAFGGYVSSPPWRLLTAPLFHRLGWSDTGEWGRKDPLGRLLPRPAPEEKEMPIWQERRDVGVQIGAGPGIPVPGTGAGDRQPRAMVGEFEYTLTPKDGRPVEIKADPKRAAEAAANAAKAQEELPKLADKLEELAGTQAGDQWPGSDATKKAIKAMRAAGAELSPENIEKLIIDMNKWKAESGGSLPIDTLSALGNEFWAPGKIWKDDQVDAAISLLYAEMAKRAQPSLTNLANQSTAGGASDRAKAAVDAIQAAGKNLNAQTHQAMKDPVDRWFRSWGLAPPSDILDPATWTVTNSMAATLASGVSHENAAQPSLTDLANRLERTVGGASDKANAAFAAIRAAGNDLNAQTLKAMNDAVAGWFRSWGLTLPRDILDPASWTVTDGMAATLQSRLRTDLDLTLPPDRRSAFRHSSPAAQQAFGAVAISNGRWNQPTWRAVEALVDQTLRSSAPPALRTRARDLRNAMGDGPGNWQITDAQNTAMDAYFAQDIRDQLRAGTPALAGTEMLEIAIENLLKGVARPKST